MFKGCFNLKCPLKRKSQISLWQSTLQVCQALRSCEMTFLFFYNNWYFWQINWDIVMISFKDSHVRRYWALGVQLTMHYQRLAALPASHPNIHWAEECALLLLLFLFPSQRLLYKHSPPDERSCLTAGKSLTENSAAFIEQRLCFHLSEDSFQKLILNFAMLKINFPWEVDRFLTHSVCLKEMIQGKRLLCFFIGNTEE